MVERKMGVYQITCTKTGAVYIGQSSDLRRRRGEHLSDLRNNQHHTPCLQDDFNLYGEECFRFDVLEYCDSQDQMDAKEIAYIADAKKRGVCYNTFSGGRSGFDVTDEFREKVAAGNRGKYVSDATRSLKSDRTKEQWQNDKYAKTMRESARSQWNDPEYREIMRKVHTGNPLACGHKLTPEIVLEARKAYADGVSVQSLADKYGVKYCTMMCAVKKRSWKYIS